MANLTNLWMLIIINIFSRQVQEMSWKNDLFSVPSFGVVTEIAKSVPPVPSLPLCSLFLFLSLQNKSVTDLMNPVALDYAQRCESFLHQKIHNVFSKFISLSYYL